VTWAIDKGYMSHEHKWSLTHLAISLVWLVGAIGLITLRCWALDTFVKLSVSITQLDGNISHLFLFIFDSLKNTR
jgi:hypothetical protein